MTEPEDIKTRFLKADISYYADMLIQNEEWITHHISRRAELKEKLEKKGKELKEHLKALFENAPIKDEYIEDELPYL